MRFQCRFGWHDWGKWSKVSIIRAYESWRDALDNGEKKIVGQLEERRCENCGKIETQRIIW